MNRKQNTVAIFISGTISQLVREDPERAAMLISIEFYQACIATLKPGAVRRSAPLKERVEARN